MRIFLLLLCGSLCGQSIRVERMRRDLEALSSKEMNGRASLEPGGEKAARYIEAEMTKAGVKTQLQEFDLIAPVADRDQSHVSYRGETLAFTGGFKDDVTVKGAAVFAGYGITAPEYNYDDYRGIDVTGKIVVVFDREPQERDAQSKFLGLGLTKHAAARTKRLNAQLHGAAAVLVIPSPMSLSAPAVSARTPLRGGATAMFDELTRIAMLTLQAGSAEKLLPGYKKIQERIDETGQPASRTIDGEVEIKLANKSRRVGKSWNAIGVLPGQEPSVVLLTSHYDHLPARGENYYPGANDNGSGTVGVIELARAFASSGQKPKKTVVFISFGAEENGLYGAYHYVAHPLFPLGETKALINLDMIGRDEAHTPQTEGRVIVPKDTRNHLNLVGGAYFPELRKLVERANRGVGLKLDDKFDHDSTQNTLWRCDHFPFLLAKVPDIWFFGGWHPGYHEPSDTVEKINWTKMEKVVRLAYLTAARVANSK